MKRLYFIGIGLTMMVQMIAQSNQPPRDARPQRSPEEIARFQTEMLVYALQITDTSTMRQLFRHHLKYVLLQQQNPTQDSEVMEQRRQQSLAEKKTILTEEQYNRFLEIIANGPKHGPHFSSHDGSTPPPPPPSDDEGGHRPPPPPDYPQ